MESSRPYIVGRLFPAWGRIPGIHGAFASPLQKLAHPVWIAKSTLNPSAQPLRWIGGCGWITVRAQFGGLADGYSMDSIDQINLVDTWWIRGGLVDVGADGGILASSS